jgi:hypothetical protein
LGEIDEFVAAVCEGRNVKLRLVKSAIGTLGVWPVALKKFQNQRFMDLYPSERAVLNLFDNDLRLAVLDVLSNSLATGKFDTLISVMMHFGSRLNLTAMTEKDIALTLWGTPRQRKPEIVRRIVFILNYAISEAYFQNLRAQKDNPGKAMRRCRVCGCIDHDCHQCIEKTGQPCHWVEDDLCSACQGEVK